jgi:hypothetical protein
VVGFFFIGGAPKSGTTWLQRALDMHPKVVCSGEGHFHEYIAGPLLEMTKAYNLKLNAVAELVYEGQPYCQPVSRAELLEITREVIRILMMRRTKPGARLFGDKTPANAKVVEDLSLIFPDMKFIRMLRDPRDVAASRLGHAVRTGHPDAADSKSGLYRDVVRASAQDWRLTVDRTEAYRQRRPGQITTVRYEDLVRDPSGELARVFRFLGAATDETRLADIVRRSSFEALSGGRKPGVEDQSSFYRKGAPGDWCNHLTEEALAIVTEECGPALRLAGYAPDAPAEPALTPGLSRSTG